MMKNETPGNEKRNEDPASQKITGLPDPVINNCLPFYQNFLLLRVSFFKKSYE